MSTPALVLTKRFTGNTRLLARNHSRRGAKRNFSTNDFSTMAGDGVHPIDCTDVTSERNLMLNEPKKHVVVVDDEQYICRIIVESLGDEFYDIVAFSNPTEALEHIGRNPVDLVLTDLVMGEHSGMQMIETTH
jgi:PleD family two-component response regulator